MNSFFKNVRCITSISAVAALLFLIVSCGTPRGGDPGQPAPANEGADLLRPGDVVIINFSGVSDPPSRVDDRIRDDGKIILPFVGPLLAAGITRSELQQKIHDAYVTNYFKQLTVSVNPDTRFIYVHGEVNRPGNHPYDPQMTVEKAIASAGGCNDWGNRKKVRLKRGNQRPKVINLEKAMRNPGGPDDLPVYPGDVIFVPRRLW